jgi:hypothetical protein
MTATEIFDYLNSFLDIKKIPSFLEDRPFVASESQAKLGTYKRVHQDRVGSDKDTAETVYYFADHDCYIQFSGYYSSYERTEYDTWLEVKPVQKTITIYEAV